jgi:hypothetical protein
VDTVLGCASRATLVHGEVSMGLRVLVKEVQVAVCASCVR